MAASASAQHVLVDEDGCQDAANAAKTLSDGEVSRAVLRRKIEVAVIAGKPDGTRFFVR